ncbi:MULTISPECIES: hypothetical protein [unclassified Caballeronia]|uniref:hypothetical protein n=1 Tax=unclassified Caballeronia TaxID=2646786 RepID=UPI002863F19D|nr:MULTISPECIES: hypothetical protein [unclassified Caballeronia]MDR5770269.1 hypothetical protein [Caballeronia sp. LZ002]MDR5845706.1 hypothetical protein [Caballeronia sp. LZ003]
MVSDTGCFLDMALIGIRTTTRFLAAIAISSLAVAGSLALAGPRVEWLSSAVFQDSASSRQSLHHTPVAAKDGLTPVSAEVRPVPRAEQAASLRGAGSIRADIARYNEERSLPRQPGRPVDDGRTSGNANFRN